jgi:uncharacterized protein
MRFAEADTPGGLAIRSCAPGTIAVGDTLYHASLIVSPQGVIPDWPPREAAALTAEHLGAALALGPEILLLGTGLTQVFPDPALYAPLLPRQVGLEIMDTAAACRTYNILMSEGRQVVAALIML